MSKRNTKLALTGIYNDLSFSEKDVWLWCRIPPLPYEFMDAQSRINNAKMFDNGLASLLTSEDKGLEFQLIVTSSPFSSEKWAEEIKERAAIKYGSPHGYASPYFSTFLKDMKEQVDSWSFKDRKVYLGIKLGRRGEFGNSNSFIPLDLITNLFSKAALVEDYYVSPEEIEFWEEKAKVYKRSLYTGNLKAEPVTASEIAYMAKKPFYPSMPVPEVDTTNRQEWGLGELDSLVDAKIENNDKYLKITQTIDGNEIVGYRATLCFARFPDTMIFPASNPWIHYSASFAYPTEFYTRFTLEPSTKVRKELGKKIAEVKDQIQNMESAGGSRNIDVSERLRQGLELDYELSKTKTPWVFARHRITVSAPTLEKLKENVQRTIDRYKDLDIQLIQPTGDQFDLLLESMPNDTVRAPAYYQRQELSIIATGTPTGSGSVGDMTIKSPEGKEKGFIGPYIGYTTSRVLSPVFLSPHAAMAQDSPPGVVITGAPGGGKSFAAFTLTYQMALQGVWTIYIDPKGDAIPMANLPGLNARVLNLKDGNAGLLDPFSISPDPAIQKSLAIEIIGLFLGGVAMMKTEQEIEVSKAITAIAAEPQPSLNKVVDFLLASPNIEGQGVGHKLNLVRELPFARLCFAPNGSESINATDGLTIITLLGLDLPPTSLPQEQYTNANRLAVAIMFLLTNYTRQLFMSSDANTQQRPKAIVIDEAWAVTATQQGLKLVLEVARMGRSLNTALVLVSQNAGDFKGKGQGEDEASITNSVSTKMAFRAKAQQEIDNILDFFGLEINEGNRDVISNLRNGECLIKDANNRIAKVQIDNWSKQMNIAFETNPEKKRQNALDAAKQK